MANGESAALWDRINEVYREVVRLQERSEARNAEIAKLERRVGRLEMAILSALAGVGYVGGQHVLSLLGVAI